MPFNMQGMEWVILILVALLVFGGTRLAGAGKNAGRAIREFKEETRAIKADEEAAKAAQAQRTGTTATGGSTAVGSTAADVADAELVEPRPVVEQKPDTTL